MRQNKPRAGRRPTEATEGEKATLSVRVSGSLKARLLEASRRNGNSLTAEMEERLALSFRDEDLLMEAMDRIYGRFLGCLLKILGEAMRDAGRVAATGSGFLSTDLDIDKTDVAAIGRRMDQAWPQDPAAYEQAEIAAHIVIDVLRPPGIPEPMDTSTMDAERVRNLEALISTAGQEVARDVLIAAVSHVTKKDDDAEYYDYRQLSEDVRDKLGPELIDLIVTRVGGV